MSTTRVRIFYPADPVGVVPGGIDTFIRGIIKWAPDDLSFSLVGMSTDPRHRPVGRWTPQMLGRRRFDCFPLVGVADAGQRSRVPLSLRYTAALLRRRTPLSRGFDVFDFHRPEPSLLFRADQRPKVAYFHQDPAVVSLGASDMLWKHLPGAYQRMEAAAAARFDRAWCVREPGVQTLRQRYPALAPHVNFIPTWVDSEVFCPPEDVHDRAWQRQVVGQALGISPRTRWIVSVGRLDTQKDPALMLDAFTRVVRDGHDVHWLVVGDGKLRADIERDARAAGVADRVHLLGLQPAGRIAELLRAADLFALSSAYEGMPMAVLEALGCGLPVVTTDVGEVRRVVQPGINGLVVQGRSPQAFAHALVQGLVHAVQWRDEPCVAATADYQPASVLAGAYDTYRALGRPVARLRTTVDLQLAESPPDRRRRRVIGVPIDQITREAARGRMLHWAWLNESRCVDFCNVHSVVEARRNERHRLVVEGADLALPDGAPVAWTLSLKGGRRQPRVDGPGTMWSLCADAQAQGLKIGLYGATSATLDALHHQLRRSFPLLNIAFTHAPPFRELTAEEDEAICEEIRQARVGLLFVGLGCPKQERWMAEHRGRIPAVMMGVGAAFDMHAGLARRAPAWMRGIGLEWAHRLAQEPGRLWRRYLSTNSRFVAWSVADALGRRPGRSEIPQSIGVSAPGPAMLSPHQATLRSARPRGGAAGASAGTTRSSAVHGHGHRPGQRAGDGPGHGAGAVPGHPPGAAPGVRAPHRGRRSAVPGLLDDELATHPHGRHRGRRTGRPGGCHAAAARLPGDRVRGQRPWRGHLVHRHPVRLGPCAAVAAPGAAAVAVAARRGDAQRAAGAGGR